VDCTNVILILTSNLGSPILIDPTIPLDQKRAQVLALVRQAFKPEFVNRVVQSPALIPNSIIVKDVRLHRVTFAAWVDAANG
jgi:ATP-dependent Clp protease ATP-binding subunit ClpA